MADTFTVLPKPHTTNHGVYKEQLTYASPSSSLHLDLVAGSITQPMASSAYTLLLPLLIATTVLLSAAPTLCYVNLDADLDHDKHSSSGYRTHIVLVRPPSDAEAADESVNRLWHKSFLILPSSLTDSDEPRLVHCYTEAFSGFTARLTDTELDAVAKKPGFVRTYPDRMLQPMTTHTPEFLGLRQGRGF